MLLLYGAGVRARAGAGVAVGQQGGGIIPLMAAAAAAAVSTRTVPITPAGQGGGSRVGAPDHGIRQKRRIGGQEEDAGTCTDALARL